MCSAWEPDKMNDLKEISHAGWFVVRMVCDAPYVYRFDGTRWYIRDDGKDYILIEDTQGVRLYNAETA
jgi:hypothetical protein